MVKTGCRGKTVPPLAVVEVAIALTMHLAMAFGLSGEIRRPELKSPGFAHSRALTPADQNTPPQPTNAIHEDMELPRVTGNGMISVVAHYNLPKPRTDLGRTVMLPARKFSLDGFQYRNHPRDDKWSSRGLSTKVVEDKECDVANVCRISAALREGSNGGSDDLQDGQAA